MSVSNGTHQNEYAFSFRHWIRHHRAVLLLALVAVLFYIVTLVFVHGFATSSHLFYVLQLAGFLGIVAVGETIVILISGIDLSVANVVTGTGILVSSLFSLNHLPFVVVILIALALAAFVGLINGVGVAYFNIPPLVMTLAMGSILEGIYLVATNGTPVSGMSATWGAIVNHNIGGGLNGSVLIWFLVIGVVTWFLTGTRMGRYLYALGTNRSVAILSGVPIKRVTVSAYMISALSAGLTGTLLVGYTGTSFSTMGDQYLLPAIAAVVLGGTSILGGKGNYIGTAIGAFLLTVVQSLLAVVNVSQAGREMLEGGILLLFILIYHLPSVVQFRRPKRHTAVSTQAPNGDYSASN